MGLLTPSFGAASAANTIEAFSEWRGKSFYICARYRTNTASQTLISWSEVLG